MREGRGVKQGGYTLEVVAKQQEAGSEVCMHGNQA